MDRRPFLILLILLAVLVLNSTMSGFGSVADQQGNDASLVSVKNVQDGILVNYDFDGENRSRVSNKASHDYHGFVHDDSRNVTYESRNGGSAIHFEGYPGHVEIANSSSMTIRDSVSFAFWIRPEENQRTNLLGAYGSSYFLIGNQSGEQVIQFVVMNNDTKMVQPNAEIPLNEWTHVVGTYDSDGVVRLFVNGKLVEDRIVDKPPTSPNKNLTINMGGWGDGFIGSIDSFSMWERSLSRDEVRALSQDRNRIIILYPPLRTAITLLLLLVIVAVTVRG